MLPARSVTWRVGRAHLCVSSLPASLVSGSMFFCSEGPARLGMISREVPTVRHFMPAYL